MPHAFLSRWPLTSGLLVLLTISAACAPAPTTAPAASTAPTPREVQVEMELGPGNFDLPDPRAGLADLSSYKATLTVSFDGKEEGQPAQWTRTYEFQFTKEPAARMWTMETAEDLAKDAPVGSAEQDGAAYEIFADGSCIARTLNPANASVEELEPAASLNGLLGAEAAGHETLQGVQAEHYTFDERALLQAGVTKSSGEVWVAPEGGTVLRYLEKTTAGENFFGKGTEGTLQRDYELTEINQAVTIELPQGCPAGLVDAPMKPDAAKVRSDPGVLQYESAASIADVKAFYGKELPAQGWVDPSTVNIPEGVSPEEYQQMMEALKALGSSQPTLVPSESEGMLVFEKGETTLSVVLTHEGSTTKVLLSLSKTSK